MCQSSGSIWARYENVLAEEGRWKFLRIGIGARIAPGTFAHHPAVRDLWAEDLLTGFAFALAKNQLFGKLRIVAFQAVSDKERFNLRFLGSLVWSGFMKFNLKHLLALMFASCLFANGLYLDQRAQILEASNQERDLGGHPLKDVPIYRIKQLIAFGQEQEEQKSRFEQDLTGCFDELASAIQVDPSPGKVGIVGVPVLKTSDLIYEWLVHVPENATVTIGLLRVNGQQTLDNAVAKLVPGENRLRFGVREETIFAVLNGGEFGQAGFASGSRKRPEMFEIQKDFDIPKGESREIELAKERAVSLVLTIYNDD